jgi:ubiquinone/menaquinone biosynthesis C-methylase UbiE
MQYSAKQTFLESEGDAWMSRNFEKLSVREFQDDRVVRVIRELPGVGPGTRLLEVGSGSGHRLQWLQEKMGVPCIGLEPSAAAVQYAKELGVESVQGTADCLPFAQGAFDIVVFGFCLYLCDRCDLFKIASEADRVLSAPGWLIILDFYSKCPTQASYRHLPGLNSYKMDYRAPFAWHPSYSCFSHTVLHHERETYTDDPNEWVALSVLRKVPL